MRDCSANEMESLRSTVSPPAAESVAISKKVESDGTAGGVLGEEFRAVLRFVFGAGGGVQSETFQKSMWLNSTK
jgi:hypothetical protein